MEKVKTCKKCGKRFRLIPMELKFYKRFGYPEPVNCPNCREKRRKVMRNPHQFFKRPCDQCGKDIITTHDPKKGRIVFCEDCFAKYYDRVDPLEADRAPDTSGKVVKV
ncbi:zinc-ribbon domain containing protein [Patescibacteria group bacterium]|nr:zinc-ribbon domain containing protein [Patescibacteria group bacterium]MBU1931318.1 zinc-ribbon domain containing protein [Patescibacteria group bacterium]